MLTALDYELSTEAQDCRQAASALYVDGRWYVTDVSPVQQGNHADTMHYTGESGLGKSTLINTLFSTELVTPKNYRQRFAKQLDKTTEVEIIKAELEERNFSVKLTVIDTPGFGDYVNNRDSWTSIVDFLDDQHENYMRQEQQPQRKDKVDLRVHACLYFIQPGSQGWVFDFLELST